MNLLLSPTRRADIPEPLTATAGTRSQGAEWHPTVKVYHEVNFQELRQELATVGSGHEELLRLGEIQTPPQSWFDDEDDPFKPE